MMTGHVIDAVYSKNYDRLKELLANGADINETDDDNRTPLMHAVLAENLEPEILKFLISRAADVNVRDGKQQWTALHFAARDQRKDMVNILLDNGAEVDPLDTLGNTPLWRCVMNISPNLDIVKALLGKGADPNKKNNQGVSPKDVAANVGNHMLRELRDE